MIIVSLAMTDEFTQQLAGRMRAARNVLPVGAGTKPALSVTSNGVVRLELSGHRGIVEYEPSEYTFTARAGTPLEEISVELARHRQYLPFDPPLAVHGATLGGTVAAGLNGPGRLRYGGMRDFILGALFLTGDGRVIRGGSKRRRL
jgi:glycolate dehydrogenase FAD-binding subunit